MPKEKLFEEMKWQGLPYPESYIRGLVSKIEKLQEENLFLREQNKKLKERIRNSISQKVFLMQRKQELIKKKTEQDLPCLLETIWKSQEYQDFEYTKNPEDVRVDGKIFIEFLKNKKASNCWALFFCPKKTQVKQNG